MRFASSRRAGFTLAEILLAMLVFAIAITTILALLARSIETTDEILLKDEAINLSSALDAYMSSLPFYDGGDPLNAYEMIGNPARRGVYAFYYRADANADPRADGTPPPYASYTRESVMGTDYFVAPTIRDPTLPAQFTYLQADDDARDGRLFFVTLRESPSNPYAMQQGGAGNLPADPDADYDSAILVIYAEFYALPALLPTRTAVDNLIDEAEPVFSFNFAVRR